MGEFALLMAPSLTVFGFVHAAFWPAQMSPDSIDQWQQILNNGGGTDAHPALWFLTNWTAYQVVHHPAFVLIMQYLLFAFAGAGLIREMGRLWALPRWGLGLAAIVFAAFPPNFLIATTIWKDVPYAAGVILLTAALARLVSRKFVLTAPLAAWIAASCFLVLGMRHNGLLVVFPLLAIFLVVAPKGTKRGWLGLIAAQVVFFALTKTVLLWAFAIGPVPSNYASIFALPVVGALVASDDVGELDQDQLEMIERVMPLDSWRSAYRCDSVVPLMWNPSIDRESMIAPEMNAIAARWAWRHPDKFARHQLCITRILWDPLPQNGEWTPISPMEITPTPLALELELSTQSKLPGLAAWISNSVGEQFGRSSFFNRPATYVWGGIISILALRIFWGFLALAIYTPAALNILFLFPIIGSPDYRYTWPSQIVGLLLIMAAAVSLLVKIGGRFTSGWESERPRP